MPQLQTLTKRNKEIKNKLVWLNEFLELHLL